MAEATVIWLRFVGELNTAYAELQNHTSVPDPNYMELVICISDFIMERKTVRH